MSTLSYQTVFITLEMNGVLDTTNLVDLFCLQYVYIPHINRSLEQFQCAWNNHSLSTESNRSPLQLYTLYSIGNPLFHDEHNVDDAKYGVNQGRMQEYRKGGAILN